MKSLRDNDAFVSCGETGAVAQGGDFRYDGELAGSIVAVLACRTVLAFSSAMIWVKLGAADPFDEEGLATTSGTG